MEKHIIYNDTKVYYEDVGDGEVTLLLHGWGANVRFFDCILNKIEGRKILIDFPPFGNSGELNNAWDLEDYIQLVKEILNKECIIRYSIVAHSFGGRVAIGLSSRYKQVDKLVLIASAGIKKVGILNKIKILNYKIHKFYIKIGFLEDDTNAYGSSDYKALNSIMKKTFVNIVNFNQRDYIYRIRANTLIIAGKNDKDTPPVIQKILYKNIFNSQILWHKGGHFEFLYNCDLQNKVLDFLNNRRN